MKKQEKKFVLAGLALLAITGLLALTGCKNDTVPEPTRYTVKFETDHGTAPDDITVVSGTKLTAEQLKVLDSTDNYIFEYWYDKDVDAQKPVEEGYTVTKDVTLVAKWRDRGTVATVNFSLPDGTKFYFGESIEVSLETTTDGAIIQYKRDDGEWMVYTEETPISVTTSTTITAKATKEGLKPSTETTATYTVRKLDGITVTSPARTVYSVGQSFDPTGMVVTATYDDGEPKDVTSLATTDFDFSSAGVKTVTVSYSEGGSPVTKDFHVDVVNVGVPTKLTTYTSPNNTDDSWTYVAFGEWPQSEAPGVNPSLVGSQPENLFKDKYYSDANGEYVEEGGKYYKVEPIVWRVLTEDYKDPDGKSTGNALLLAESILTGGIPYYVDSSTRTITGAGTKNGETVIVYPNNWQYSTVRAWLNGSYEANDTQDKTYDGIGFLQTAFTESARKLIELTSVDNSATSTTDAGNNLTLADGCSDTTDKIFLLSEKEATTGEYGFAEYNVYVGDGTTLTSTRIRVTTDYAQATGADQSSTEGFCGWWWLRSPYFNEYIARDINFDGRANDFSSVFNDDGGVVPALSISLGGN